MAASGSAGNFQSIPALKPDQVPIPTTAGSVNMYMNLDDNLNIWTVDTFKVHRSIGGTPAGWIKAGTFNFQQWKDSLNQPSTYESIIDIATIPQANTVDSIAFQVINGFTGVNISQVTCDTLNSIGDGVFIGLAGVNSIKNRNGSAQQGTFNLSADWPLQAKLTVFDGEATGLISNLSAGSITIWYKKDSLPQT